MIPVPVLDDLKSTPDEELSEAQLRIKYTPSYIGPTWKRNEDGDFILPERTLGWGVVEWAAEWLRSLDENVDPDADEPLMLTLEQLRFVLWWYAVDERGRFVYRQGVLQRLKGWG